MSENDVYSGRCYCGAVTVSVQGAPLAAGLCHCEDCQKFHAAPFMAWNVWPSDQVEIGGDTNASTKSPHLQRVSCKACGGNVMGVLPDMGMTVVFPSTLKHSGLAFTPQFHQFYGEHVVSFADGLPKFANKPAEFGGDGERIDEPATTQWRK